MDRNKWKTDYLEGVAELNLAVELVDQEEHDLWLDILVENANN